MGRLAVIAGGGTLPVRIMHANPGALFVAVGGTDCQPPDGAEVLPATFERIGTLFKGMHAAGVTDVVFAGGLVRPRLNPLKFDSRTVALAPRLMHAMKQGDDTLLRAVVAAFESGGFTVRGATEVADGLTAPAGPLVGPAPGKTDLADIGRAAAILSALGPLDVGQGAVVAQGLVLGIETAQGTDAMLGFVADTRGRFRREGGVLLKAPKPGQDLRIDMPAIGPGTIEAAHRAGLNGIAFGAGRTLLLDRDEMSATARRTGLFLYGHEV